MRNKQLIILVHKKICYLQIINSDQVFSLGNQEKIPLIKEVREIVKRN